MFGCAEAEDSGLNSHPLILGDAASRDFGFILARMVARTTVAAEMTVAGEIGTPEKKSTTSAVVICPDTIANANLNVPSQKKPRR